MRIAHLASEVVPFSKTGGLADVVGALPAALAALGHDLTVVAPGHRQALSEELPGKPTGEVEVLGYRATLRIVEQRGVRFVLLDCPPLFVRPALYALPDGDFPDNAFRYSFFARAALAALTRLGGIDIVHAHDWQAALAPLLLANDEDTRTALPDAKSVLTIHNLAYQGVFAPWVLEQCVLPEELFTISTLEFYGDVNILKGGIVSADAITTVSPTYAREILTPQFGCRLEGVLGSRRDHLVGILNGLDLDEWNPASDPHLPRGFGRADVAAGKLAARVALGVECGLHRSSRPLLGMVSRLAEQKGADLLAAAIDDIIAMGFDLVLLGTGERRYEEAMRAAQHAHPASVAVLNRFDNRLAHLIYAASDIFLMPSRYEPCGLGQMIAMRYGSLPLVHRTGGLADTVDDATDDDGTGFVFDELTPDMLIATLWRAFRLFGNRDRLARLRANAMARNFSWDTSARRYLELYQQIQS
jgi:starch synthase